MSFAVSRPLPSQPALNSRVTTLERGRVTHVFEGDSLMAEAFAPPSIATLLDRAGAFTGRPHYNGALSGSRADNVLARFASTVTPYAPGVTQDGIFYLLVGANDIEQGYSAATVTANILACYAAARALGFKVCACTVLPSLWWADGDAQDLIRQTINANLRAAGASYDFLADLAQLVPLYRSDLFADDVHPSLAGRKLIAGAIRDALQGKAALRLPKFHIAHHSGNQAITAGVAAQVIHFTQVPSDPDRLIATDSGPTITIAGDYHFEASVIILASPTLTSEQITLDLCKNGIAMAKLSAQQGVTGVSILMQMGGCTTLFGLVTGDIIDLRIYTDIVGGVAVRSVPEWTYLKGRMWAPEKEVPAI